MPRVDIPALLAAEVQSALNSGEDLVLLDIRIQQEVDKYYIDHPKRLVIPFNSLLERVGEIPQGKKIIIVDVNGQRGPTSGRFLSARGFSDVVFLNGGMQRWVVEGMPVKTGN
ncbi:rhodanese-like domain-containing protein [Geoalkalibacter halelectricus]|uniref:Rhodanese-like domain-containing protein n=1 Tax=Geoalkalibacter halelectricus TaxID=2847045 RepID=A0ABY5ZLK1_9BACT|nr:rhodanese-like domain-containing protein [Geoalkalibacter halelectricus]MDO3378663.1 rhodanese-like domain-containing protein [Geoalkalibacter halelectricus]UWZ80026.1 rhodanese-like domain-containing protein [Geoalkalibacter halelectricus]